MGNRNQLQSLQDFTNIRDHNTDDSRNTVSILIIKSLLTFSDCKKHNIKLFQHFYKNNLCKEIFCRSLMSLCQLFAGYGRFSFTHIILARGPYPNHECQHLWPTPAGFHLL